MAKTEEATEQAAPEQQEAQAEAPAEDAATQAQTAEFAEAVEGEVTGAGTSIDILLDMNVPVTVAIGKMEVTVQRLLQLGPGSVLKLDKSIDTPADLYLKNTKFATGSIVVIDNMFAVRIEEVLGAVVITNSAQA